MARAIIIALALAVFLVGAWALIDVLRDPVARPVVPTVDENRVASSERDRGAVRRLPPLGQLPQTRQRPLFEDDRRPPALPPAEPAPPAAAKPPPDVVLQGVVEDERGQRVLLQIRRTGKLVWLSKGEALDGWEVVSIERSRIVFRNGARRHVVVLPDKTGQ